MMKKNLFCLPDSCTKKWLLLLLSFAFIAAGANHFVNSAVYVSIMPAYLPAHLELVYISGFFEILGGFGILFCRLRFAAGIGLILLTLAVFPANINMALNSEDFANTAPAWVWYARLPLQLLILVWIYFSCLSRQPR